MFCLIALLLFVAIGMKCDDTKAKSSKITHELQIDAFIKNFRSAFTFDVAKALTGEMHYRTVSASLAESMLPIGQLLTNKSKTNSICITPLGQKLKSILFIAYKSRRKALPRDRNSYMRIYEENISNLVDSLLQDLARGVNCSAFLAKKCSAIDFTALLHIIRKAFVFNCLSDSDKAGSAQDGSTALRHLTTMYKPARNLIDCIPILIVDLQKGYQQDIVDITQFYKDEFVKMQVVVTFCKYLETGKATLRVATHISAEIASIVHSMLYEINYRLDLSWKEEVRSRVMHFMDNRYPSHVLPSNYRTFAYTLWMQISHLGSFDSKYQVLVTAHKSRKRHKSYQYVTCWKELDCLYIDDLPSINIVVARHFTTDGAAEVSKYMCTYKEKLTSTLKELMQQNVGIGHMPEALSTSLGWNSLVSKHLYNTLVLYSSDGDGCLIHADGVYTNAESHWEILQAMNRSECRKVKLFLLQRNVLNWLQDDL